MTVLDGEARAERIADALLEARMIAASIQKQRGRDPRSHRLFEQPGRVYYDNGLPTFAYIRPVAAYSLRGTPEEGLRLTETRFAGSLVLHASYSASGRLIDQERRLRGAPEAN